MNIIQIYFNVITYFIVGLFLSLLTDIYGIINCYCFRYKIDECVYDLTLVLHEIERVGEDRYFGGRQR